MAESKRVINSMKLWKKIVLGALVLLFLAISLGPFFVPVSALGGLVAEDEFIEVDSKFIEINEVTIHYKERGSGERAFILLHPFGGSTYSWREVMDDLAPFGRVIAYDRPAFGLTERPFPETWTENPYGMKANIELLRGLLDAFGIEKAVLVGNSAGGGVAVAFAIGPLLMRDYQESLPNTIRREWFDQTKLTDEIMTKHLELLRIEGWDRAFYELTFAPAYPELRPLLPDLTVPTYIIAGQEDRLIRSWYFETITAEIPGAQLALIPNCGHVPQEECPHALMAELKTFLDLK
jgi:pimeloyl-ACP methyl ester carboxylesterase